MSRSTDADFVNAWEQAMGSPSVVAKILDLDIRSVYRRRDKLESKGVPLPTTAIKPRQSSTTSYPQGWSYARERQAALDNGTVIIFSDAHFWPGEKTAANLALLELIKTLKPAHVIANGDVFDGAKISRHDPHGWGTLPTVKEELDACRDRMHEIVLAANPRKTGCEFSWNMGNHCSRFDRYLVNNASDFGGVVARLSDHFNEWAFAWSLRINKNVMVKHRWHNGIHATYNNALKGGMTIVTGHLHRLAITPWGDYNGRRYGVDTGTLSDPLGPQFEYLENNPTPWCSGFAVLTFRDGKLLPPELCEVHDGTAYFRGQVVG